MTDREMVTALRAGDQLAIGQIYDTYGARLYAYCYDLLADHELAADALRDAFIVANNRVRELANPDELGAWLYALTRNEAMRVGVSDDIPSDAAQSTRGDKFARAALDVYAMLPPESREILDMAFRHRMVDADLALVLDLPEEQVSSVVQDAQEDLENGLTAVLANRVGDPRCTEIAELGKRFDRLDGKGVDPWLEAVARHVKQDRACADHISNRRPLRLFEELPHAFVPPGVRARVLDTLRDPAGTAFCARIASRAGSFDESGFPTGSRASSGSGRKMLPILGSVAVVAAVAVGAFAFMGGNKNNTTSNTGSEQSTSAPSQGGDTGASQDPNSGLAPTVSDSGPGVPSGTASGSSSPTKHASGGVTTGHTTDRGTVPTTPTSHPTTHTSTPPTTPSTTPSTTPTTPPTSPPTSTPTS